MQKIYVVLDDASKKVVKVDNSLINAGSITIVTELSEITKSDLNQDVTVVLLEGILSDSEIYVKLRMYKWIYDTRFVFLCCNSNQPTLTEYGRVYACDLRVLDYELIQAAVFQDTNIQTYSTSLFQDSKAFAESVKPGEQTTDVVLLAQNYLCSLTRENELSRENDELKKMLHQSGMKCTSLQSENNRWESGCKSLIERTIRLNSTLQRYEQVFSSDVYTKLRLQDFQNRPSIVYLKQFNDFLSLDLLVETIVDAFRIQKGLSVKVLCLLDSEDSHKTLLLPEYYTVLRNQYSLDTVINSDYVCKTGNYTNLLEKLLLNKYGLDVLVIVDMKDYNDVVLEGSFLQYNLCREKRHALKLGLPIEYTVINEPDDHWLYWETIDLSKYTKNEAFLKLSSTKIVQNILRLSSMFANAF